MTDTWTDAEREQYFAPGVEDEYQEPPVTEHYESLFDAPDYASFIKPEQTPRAKEYETKVKSMLKTTALAAFESEHVIDGCTILHYGPRFAKAAGNVADVSPHAAQAIDILTTPDNPWVVFAFASIPFVLQFIRNHETEAEQIQRGWREERKARKAAKAEAKARGEAPPKREGTPVRIRLPFGKRITIHVHIPRPSSFVKVFHAQTKQPNDLANQVLSNKKVRDALEKQGIRFMVVRDGEK